MSYPQAPWTLQGYSIQSLQPIDIEQARPLVPAELEIVSVFPGKTLGGIYVASYETGSTLLYNELIVVAALTRYANQIGSWVSHIYVDNPDSVAGGREIWGLPKQLAQFVWERGNHKRVSVYQDNQLLCRFEQSWQIPTWRQPLKVTSFSTQDADLLSFEAEASANFSLLGADLQVPSGSPFHHLSLDQPRLVFYADQLRLSVGSPQQLATRVKF
ncbi:MAG: acetoacetate decarboxylase family protein [Leptolyngbyaceae cyanobacterium RM2_2_4]|nr:acetoacetate decarboxylase family protein [Leptolyngbyaceae cyanobacterium SM1_4_3]NJO48599.1 acetoacetate decarboxylase family protein [Leptolyngbyaceae cyanobacterium RM2_2_4]